MEEARGEVQQLKKLRQRSEQSVQNLEDEVSQLKSLKKKPSDTVGDEDTRKEVKKLVSSADDVFVTNLHVT